MYRPVIVLFGCLILSLQATESQFDSISFGLIHVPGIMEPDSEHAPYNKLFNHLVKQNKFAISSTFYPYNRGEMLMGKKQVDCLFPVVNGLPREDHPSIYSDTINIVSVYLFSMQSEFKSFTDIPGKTVVHLDAYKFGNRDLEGKEKVSLIPVGSQESALNVLKSGRATAYMDYYPDVKLSLSKKDFSLLMYPSANPIRSFGDSVECSESEKIVLLYCG